MVENFNQRDTSFWKMEQLAILLHLKPAKQTVDPSGHKDGVDVSKIVAQQIQNQDSIDISKYLPINWDGTRATQIELMQLILDINQEGIVFRDHDWQDKLTYYQQQLRTLMGVK
jgi:hypothetical protein